MSGQEIVLVDSTRRHASANEQDVFIGGQCVGSVSYKPYFVGGGGRFLAVLNGGAGYSAFPGLLQGFGDTALDAVKDAILGELEDAEQFITRLKTMAQGIEGIDLSRPVLMSAENPSGWKLEELLARLQVEVQAKQERIVNDASEVAEQVRVNNQVILDCLGRAENLQRDSYKSLSQLGKDQASEGKPRIGAKVSEVA